jgi:hypothetical protein
MEIVTFVPPRKGQQISLTSLEVTALSAALASLQMWCQEVDGELNPTLARIQTKLGEEPHGQAVQ